MNAMQYNYETARFTLSNGGATMESSTVKDEHDSSNVSESIRFDSSFGVDTMLTHVAMMLVYAGLFGILANSMQLDMLQALFVTGLYFGSYTVVRFIVRFKRLVVIMFSRPVAIDAFLMVVSIIAAACGYCSFVYGGSFPELGMDLLCVMGLMMGIHASLMSGLWAELSSPKGSMSSVAWHMIPVCIGVLIALVVMFLQEQVRECVFFALCPLSSLVWIISGVRKKCRKAKDAIESRNVFYALAPRTHLYWTTLMLAFGIAYAVGFRYWSVAFGAGALVTCLVVGAFFPFIKSKLMVGLGETSRVYLPLCILVSFCIASSIPYVFPFAMLIAIAFVFYQGLSNITFLINYAHAFNESVMFKLSEGRFPPLIGLFLGIVIGMLMGSYEQLISPLVWVAIPCLACMSAVFMYTLQIFNQGNPVNEGVVRNLDDGIESPWHGNDTQEMEAFKQRCQKFAEEKQLTPRETEVFFLLACGYNTVSIAEVLMVSPSTVKTHFYRIYTKVDMHSQQEIIMHMRG